MSDATRPPDTDIQLHATETRWSVACPPRLRGRYVTQAAIGTVAGTLLVLLAIGGVFEAISNPHSGARVFLIGWLAPLGVIGILMLWVSVRAAARAWQTDVLECDSIDVTHSRRGGPLGDARMYTAPLDRIEPFEAPVAQDDAESDAAHIGPFYLRYRVAAEEKVYTHECLPNATFAEQRWLARELNDLLARC